MLPPWGPRLRADQCGGDGEQVARWRRSDHAAGQRAAPCSRCSRWVCRCAVLGVAFARMQWRVAGQPCMRSRSRMASRSTAAERARVASFRCRPPAGRCEDRPDGGAARSSAQPGRAAGERGELQIVGDAAVRKSARSTRCNGSVKAGPIGEHSAGGALSSRRRPVTRAARRRWSLEEGTGTRVAHLASRRNCSARPHRARSTPLADDDPSRCHTAAAQRVPGVISHAMPRRQCRCGHERLQRRNAAWRLAGRVQRQHAGLPRTPAARNRA